MIAAPAIPIYATQASNPTTASLRTFETGKPNKPPIPYSGAAPELTGFAVDLLGQLMSGAHDNGDGTLPLF